MAICNADTAGCEETCQSTFGSPSPADPLPFRYGQQRFGRDWRPIWDVVFARPSSFRDGEDQSDVGGIDVLASRHPYRPSQAALAQSLTERPAGAVPGIGKDAAETRARDDDAVDLLDRYFRLCQRVRLTSGTRARAMRSGSSVQFSGRNSRRPTITGTSRDANVILVELGIKSDASIPLTLRNPSEFGGQGLDLLETLGWGDP